MHAQSVRGMIREPGSGGFPAFGAIAHHGHARAAEKAGPRDIARGDGTPALWKSPPFYGSNRVIRGGCANERRFAELAGATMERADQPVTVGRLSGIGEIARRIRCALAGQRGQAMDGLRKERGECEVHDGLWVSCVADWRCMADRAIRRLE